MCSHSPRRAADRRSGCQSQRMLQDPWKSTSFVVRAPKFYDVLSGWKKTHVVRWGTNIIYQFIAPIHPIKPSKTGVICTNCANPKTDSHHLQNSHGSDEENHLQMVVVFMQLYLSISNTWAMDAMVRCKPTSTTTTCFIHQSMPTAGNWAPLTLHDKVYVPAQHAAAAVRRFFSVYDSSGQPT